MLFEISHPSFYSVKQTENKHKKVIYSFSLVCLPRDKHTRPDRQNKSTRKIPSQPPVSVKLRMARWRDSHMVFTETSTQVDIKWT